MAAGKVWQSKLMAAAMAVLGCMIGALALSYSGGFDLSELPSAFVVLLMTVQSNGIEMNWRADEVGYRELFEQAPQPMWVYDCETLQFLAVNAAALTQYGFNREEFLKMHLPDVRLAETGRARRDELDKVRTGDTASTQSSSAESHHRRKDGTVFPVELTSRRVLWEGRRAMLLVSTDLSDRKRAEKRAQAFSILGRRLSAARIPKDAAQIVMDTAEELFGWDACTFDLCSPDQNRISTVLYIDTIGGRRVDVSPECLGTTPSRYAREAFEAGAQLVLRAEPIELPAHAIPFGDKTHPSASLMFAPIRNNERAIGVLSIQSYRPGAYTEDDLRTLQALADHCSGALDRIRAEQEIERLNGELEKRVQDRTAQLEAINKELETFSYSVSHDLRAPLRSIRGFSEVLLERHAGQLDERGREFLRRACESSQHMDLLIEDLLKFSRVGRSELVRQPVDLSGVAESIAGELRKAEPARAVDFIIAPGLLAEADPRLLRVALDNLLRNAWKFTGNVPRARIEFGFAETPEPSFFVRDNGAGFDMQYVGKLFGVFQRLHSTSEFPGTGVGLATVQRIINRHRGRVWATGAPGQGATFCFTLPRAGEF